ncbi:hypothetical protein ACIRPH_31095 [Nocardiopsis sp. NPDC101807]|uniref:hypothetical protein n=1 Tax=Nocardiopsis sp. NPDC101807 TaxID=3364339 RepID=UPI00380D7D02
MPFVKFSYPVGGHPVGEPIHLSEEKAAAHIRDGVAVACAPPEVKAPVKTEVRGEPGPESVSFDAKTPRKPVAKKSSE